MGNIGEPWVHAFAYVSFGCVRSRTVDHSQGASRLRAASGAAPTGFEGYLEKETRKPIDDLILVERSQFFLVPYVDWKSRERGKRKHRLVQDSPTHEERVVRHR